MSRCQLYRTQFSTTARDGRCTGAPSTRRRTRPPKRSGRDAGGIRRHLRPAPLRHRHLHRRPRSCRSKARPACTADGAGRHRAAGQYEYPSEVKFEIRQNVKADYARAAEFVNYSHVRLVSIQHEYGIFGGEDGGYILDFLTRVARAGDRHAAHCAEAPFAATKAAIVQQMAQACARLVVMSQVAKDLLASSYDVGGCEGTNHPPRHSRDGSSKRSAARSKPNFGVAGRRMLLTFGLLSPNKGIETVIRALPAVVASVSRSRLLRGRARRIRPSCAAMAKRIELMLEREAEKPRRARARRVSRSVRSADELRKYLQAADIFVSPYLNEAQVTSGALSYAMGAGAAVVSTPYWHAQELLADGRGRLFPFRDHAALEQARCSSCSARRRASARARGSRSRSRVRWLGPNRRRLLRDLRPRAQRCRAATHSERSAKAITRAAACPSCASITCCA